MTTARRSSSARLLWGATASALLMAFPTVAFAQTNTIYGNGALPSNTGSTNTAVGAAALSLNTGGSANTAYGYASLANATGSNNVAVGVSAGRSIKAGSYNITVGNYGQAADSGTIRIGATGAQTATYISGIFAKTAPEGAQVFVNSDGKLGTLVSSRRFKEDIRPLGPLADKLLRLRPVAFRYKREATGGVQPVQYGLIAEEVAKVFPELVQRDEKGKPFSVHYHLITPLLLGELQKEHEHNGSQQAALGRQQAEITGLKRQIVAQQREQQRQATETTALQLKLGQLDRLIQASRPDVRLSQK